MKPDSNRILSIIAHDLKDPLTSIAGIAEILINNRSDFQEEEILEILNEIRDTSESALNLLSELLDWSNRINSSSAPEKQLFDAGHEIGLLMSAVMRKAEWKGIELKNEVSGEVLIEGEKNIFQTIFRNLLANAIKSCHGGGKITVTATPAEQRWQFCIADNGIGMTSRQLQILFPDKKATPGTNVPDQYGNGMGLIICRDFIRLTGGQLWAESSEGEGTRVYFTF